jgi:hypothetical protein
VHLPSWPRQRMWKELNVGCAVAVCSCARSKAEHEPRTGSCIVVYSTGTAFNGPWHRLGAVNGYPRTTALLGGFRSSVVLYPQQEERAHRKTYSASQRTNCVSR